MPLRPAQSGMPRTRFGQVRTIDAPRHVPQDCYLPPMVRPEGLVLITDSCFSQLAGESPVRVSVGAPGSRPQPWDESLMVTAGRQKPLEREQARGPQHHVNPAASSEEQCESRAAHVTAKAMGDANTTDRASPLAGVWGAARAHSALGNRRDPSVQPVGQRPGV